MTETEDRVEWERSVAYAFICSIPAEGDAVTYINRLANALLDTRDLSTKNALARLLVCTQCGKTFDQMPCGFTHGMIQADPFRHRLIASLINPDPIDPMIPVCTCGRESLLFDRAHQLLCLRYRPNSENFCRMCGAMIHYRPHHPSCAHSEDRR